MRAKVADGLPSAHAPTTARVAQKPARNGVPGGGLLLPASTEQQPHLRRAPSAPPREGTAWSTNAPGPPAEGGRRGRRRRACMAARDPAGAARRPRRRTPEKSVRRRHRPAAGRVPRPDRDRGVAADAGTVRRRAHAKACSTCVEIKILRRVLNRPRRPPRHRCDACSMAWRCRSSSLDGARRKTTHC